VQDEWKLTLRLSGFRAEETGKSSRVRMLRNVEVVVIIGEEQCLPLRRSIPAMWSIHRRLLQDGAHREKLQPQQGNQHKRQQQSRLRRVYSSSHRCCKPEFVVFVAISIRVGTLVCRSIVFAHRQFTACQCHGTPQQLHTTLVVYAFVLCTRTVVETTFCKMYCTCS
jgi:hypothetical protein